MKLVFGGEKVKFPFIKRSNATRAIREAELEIIERLEIWTHSEGLLDKVVDIVSEELDKAIKKCM